MAALADCTSYYFREMWLRMVYFNEMPPWESNVNGNAYLWSPTEFAITLHKTATLTDAGDDTTNLADYTGYATLIYPRGPASWTLVGSGTQNPIMKPTVALVWPKNTGADQDIYAMGISMRLSGVNYPMEYVNLSAPVTIPTNTIPYVAPLDMQMRTR